MEEEDAPLPPPLREYSLSSIISKFASRDVLYGAASLLALRVGASIAFSHINADLAGIAPQPDKVNLVSSIAGTISGLFGGSPVEPLISGTAASPMPVVSGVMFMAIIASFCYLKLFKFAKYLPEQMIAGFLFVLGIIVTFPQNIELSLQADPVLGSLTAIATGITDPFTGMIIGILFKYLIQLIGINM